MVIGYLARSLATYGMYVGPPRARNATLAVALSGSFLPVIYPCHLPMLVLVVWPGPCCLLLHKRVELDAGTGSPDVNTVAKRTN